MGIQLQKLLVGAAMWCSILAFASAQENTRGSITGQIIDAATKRPLELVNVLLQRTSDSTLIAGIATDKNGKFAFQEVQAGEYYCRCSLVGYATKLTVPILIDAGHRNANLGKVGLRETAVSLDEILVTREKAMENISIDRKIYNVDQDLMSKSGSASEILQKLPSVEVDIDGNVSLRGSSNVLMLINGKNSSLMGRNRAEVLQQLPASTIERIEVITNPSAKYKPDGTSGIINIVLKRNSSLGMNGGVTANVGNQGRYNGNIRLSYKPGDFDLYASYSFRQDSRNRINSDSRIQSDTALSYFRQDLASYADPISHMITLGCEADFDETNNGGASGHYFHNAFTRTDYAHNAVQDVGMIPTQAYDRNRLDHEYQEDYGFDTFFEHKFPAENHKLRAEFSFSGHPEKEDNHYTNLFSLPAAPAQYDNTLIQPLENKTQVSLEYSDPLTEHSTLEAGYAGEFNYSNYDFNVSYFDPSQQALVTDLGKTSRFIFNETIHALYATYYRSFGDFSLLAGLRTEQSYTTPNLVTRDSVFSNSYLKLYPTLHLSYRISEAAELQLNYSRRVHRPESEDLNPFPEYRDPRNIQAGNPALLPEFIHSVEFGCKLQNSLLSVIPSVYYRYTSNRFTTVTQVLNDSTLLTTRTNLANDQSAGLEVIVLANIGDLLTSNLSVNAFYDQIDATNLGYGAKKSVFTWSGALTVSLNVAKGTMFQLNSNYGSYRLTPQGESRPSYVVNVGARQDLLDARLSLSLTVADVFHTLKRELQLSTPMLNQTVINRRDAGIVYFGLSYHFGAETKKSKEDQLRYDDGL
jgi:outer membrane receptor protein involved in Fe transport